MATGQRTINKERFSVRLLIKHPNMDPEKITDTLQLQPHLMQLAGADRITPQGERLPGKYRLSCWSYAFDKEGTRFFFKEITTLLKKLEPHASFLRKIVATGGSAQLIVDLSGDCNIGDVISHEDLKRIAALRLDLGLEVFPVPHSSIRLPQSPDGPGDT